MENPEIQNCREKQSYYLNEFDQGNISKFELDLMLKLWYEKLVELGGK